MKKPIALLLTLVMVIGLAVCGGSAAAETKAPVTTDLPRDETLYFAGQQWGCTDCP